MLLKPVAGDQSAAVEVGLQVGFITPVELQTKLKSGPAFTLTGKSVTENGVEFGDVQAPLFPIIVNVVFAVGVTTIEVVVAPLLQV